MWTSCHLIKGANVGWLGGWMACVFPSYEQGPSSLASHTFTSFKCLYLACGSLAWVYAVSQLEDDSM